MSESSGVCYYKLGDWIIATYGEIGETGKFCNFKATCETPGYTLIARNCLVHEDTIHLTIKIGRAETEESYSRKELGASIFLLLEALESYVSSQCIAHALSYREFVRQTKGYYAYD